MRSPGLLCSFLIVLSGSAFAQTTDCQEVSPEANPGDQLGCSVATDGAISAFGANMGNGGRGSVTVSGVSQPVVAADGAMGDQFGFATMILGNTLIVGSPTADVQGLRDAGAVYVFRRNGGPWVQQAKITAPDAAVGAQLGFSLAFNGQVLAVGAPQDSARGSLSGAVYLFEERSGEWVQMAKLTSDRTRPFDEFGYAVALSGSRLAVSAPFADGRAGGNQGAVVLFERRSGGWIEVATLVASSAAAGDELGGAVALDGATLAAGARRADVEGAVDAGRVYVFEGAGETWWEHARLTAPGGGSGDLFGGAVALDDGRLVAGASQAGGGAGLAYVFEQDEAGGWHFQKILRPAAGGRFGFSIALNGDTVVIGAFLARGGAGSASVCPLASSADLEITLTVPDSARPGEQITHLLTIKNNGPDPATGIVVSEMLPAELQLPASLPEGCTPQAGGVSCSLSEALAPRDSTTVRIPLIVGSSCAERIESRATVNARNDPTLNTTPPAFMPLLLTADLEVKKMGPPAEKLSDELSYALTVTNHGPDCARAVALTDSLPAGVVSLAPPVPCDATPARVRCPLGNLLRGEVRVTALSFRVVPAVPGTIVNTARVESRSADPKPGNSSSTVRTQVDFPTDGTENPIPALSGTGLLALAVLLALFALLRLRRRPAL